MRILLTGGTGAVGRRILEKLAGHAERILCLSRHEQVLPRDNISFLKGDMTDPEVLKRLKAICRGFDCIVHYAALIPRQGFTYSREMYYGANHTATLNLLDLCVNNGIPRLIYASSIAVVGRVDVFPIEEDTIPRPDNVYALSKLFGEAECEFYRRGGMVRTASLRISAPYGYCCHPETVLPQFLKRALKSEDIPLYGSGTREQDFIHVDDIAEVTLRVLARNFTGVLNVASGRPVSMRELAEMVLRALPDSRSKIVYLPRPDPQEGRRMRISVEKARKDLDFVPSIALDTGLKRYAERLRAEQSAKTTAG